jgi:hypothetical protein
MLDFRPDLVVSLGPNCRNAFNLRRFVGDETAYPFDWWITPVRSMLAMIRSDFTFDLQSSDLSIENDGDTVLNRRLNLLHHHDFPRNRANQKRVETLDPTVICELNAKYRSLFTRLHDRVAAASRPLFVLNGLKRRLDGGLHAKILDPALNAVCTDAETIAAVHQAFGGKGFTVIIEAAAEPMTVRHAHGLRIELAGDGTDEVLPPGFGWAQPTGVFRRAYQALGLDVAGKAGPAAKDASRDDTVPYGA